VWWLSGRGVAAGRQQGQQDPQKTPASRVGLCIGAVLPPHLQHGGLMSTDRQHADGPVVGTNLDRFRGPVGCGPNVFRIFGVFIIWQNYQRLRKRTPAKSGPTARNDARVRIRFTESCIGCPRWCGASRGCISPGCRLTGHTRIAYFLRPDCLTVGQ
jgi:hypothetical protein